MTIELWGIGTPRTFRPIWVLEEVGVPYVIRAIGPRTGETQTADFTALNRKQKIPFLSDRQVRLSESLAICRYLIEAFPAAGIWRPETLEERTKLDEWCCYIYGELDETALYVMRRHRDLAHIFGDAPAALTSSQEYLVRQLAILADGLDQAATVMPQGFSLADILLISCLDWAKTYDIGLPGSLDRYRAKIAERPAYQRAMNKNYVMKASDHGTS